MPAPVRVHKKAAPNSGEFSAALLHKRLGGAARPPASLHVTRKPPTAPAPRELLQNRLHVSWPYIPRKFEEVPPGFRHVHEVLRQRPCTLGGVAGNAGRDYVAARVIATFHSWLYMVYT